MLPILHQVLFAIFALAAVAVSFAGFRKVYTHIRAGRDAVELRFDRPFTRLAHALSTTLSQSRVFKDRPLISFLHSLIMYGFTFYLLVNLIDAVEGFVHIEVRSDNPFGILYNLLADLLSVGVLLGVIGLVVRRFSTRGKWDFSWNERTLLHPKVKAGYISKDSIIVSSFILFHVGCRIVGQAFKLIYTSEAAGRVGDPFQPFASGLASLLVSIGITPAEAFNGYVFGYWGALGSILLFLSYFPYSKHIHLFMAPVNYALKRFENSGTLPLQQVDLEAEELKIGAKNLTDLEWPRLVDAYACIQCNRCQDVCPGTTTGKALSPAALEINKRMAFNANESDVILLDMVISPEAVWACTTCGACMEVCPVQNEQMLDIIDIRRHQVMVEGDFPQELNMAFRGMERAGNPWGISQDKRMDWAQGLRVPTIDQNPEPDVLYWVGCAAAYDPGAQKVARSFVQLLERAKVNFAVLGKKETCTGDSARRAGNELLFQQLAERNVGNLNAANARLIVSTCPHCMNTLRNEYPQFGGNYQVMHHTEYLELLLKDQRLQPVQQGDEITFHDPCYLGRHNGVYDAPREVIKSMGATILELERTREKSFCCGAGGAQFWKEEEEGEMRVSESRFKEIQRRLDNAKEGKTVAVGCPFCKSMLNSSPSKAESPIEVKDVAELLLERTGGALQPEPQQPAAPEQQEAAPAVQPVAQASGVPQVTPAEAQIPPAAAGTEDVATAPEPTAPRKKWGSKGTDAAAETTPEVAPEGPAAESQPAPTEPTARKKWGAAKTQSEPEATPVPVQQAAESPDLPAAETPSGAPRKKWGASKGAETQDLTPSGTAAEAQAPDQAPAGGAAPRKKWGAKPAEAVPSEPNVTVEAAQTPVEPPTSRPKWGGKSSVEAQPATEPQNAVPAAETAQPAPVPAVEQDAPAPRKKWGGKGQAAASEPLEPPADAQVSPSDDPVADPAAPDAAQPEGEVPRKKWKPRS